MATAPKFLTPPIDVPMTEKGPDGKERMSEAWRRWFLAVQKKLS